MFHRKTIIIVILFCHIFIVLAKNKDRKTISTVPELTAKQLEEAKKFYEKVNEESKIEPEPEDMPLQASADSTNSTASASVKAMPKTDMSLSLKFIDALLYSVFPVGDKYEGMPDTFLGLGKYCLEFALKGLTFLAYTTVRYPHKFLLKAMIAVGALAWTTTNAVYCLNPISISRFVTKAKIVNRNQEELAKINEEWKVRIQNTVDKINNVQVILKHGCCAWLEYKRKMIDATPTEAKEFLASYYSGYFKMHQLVFCQQYQDGTGECEAVQYIDDEPTRVLPRSMITICVELMTKFA